MRIISYNVNGIRAAIKKGFAEWIQTDPADIICLQESKATQEDVDLSIFEKAGYHSYWFTAQKKGYSGVVILTKIKPDAVHYGSNMEQSDMEGRVIRADFGDITLVNAYYPSGTSGDERQAYKYIWLDEFQVFLTELKKTRPNLIVVGDYNIAHEAIDIHDPKGNKKSSGFLPEERAWMTQFLASGWIDSFRHLHPEATGAYSWWSQRFPSVRLNNKGWRIDYICLTESLGKQLKAAAIYPDVKHSDHCPIYAEIK
ncbi:exodeoxyribonuclease III [Sediminibacterium sp. TEGAF015]|uniref:exodeoxyribonuclease III n=1 Tax=Sediminibacterium sp. TEGAF015 TaxID=575378 RepID=UPI0021FEA078|nr:exodeoxyribonuclease III [Sediminibacterium sp. TEGAF015]BDQ12529.1 exodeoxyribonuclease [Sediminibacterium sp. TEGAF015]